MPATRKVGRWQGRRLEPPKTSVTLTTVSNKRSLKHIHLIYWKTVYWKTVVHTSIREFFLKWICQGISGVSDKIMWKLKAFLAEGKTNWNIVSDSYSSQFKKRTSFIFGAKMFLTKKDENKVTLQIRQ